MNIVGSMDGSVFGGYGILFGSPSGKKSDSCVAPPLTVDGSPTNDKSQRRRKTTRAIFAARTTNELHLQLFIVEKPFFVYTKAFSCG